MNATRIAHNLAAIRQRIDEAAARSGRSGSDVTLVAVTKYVDLPQTRALLDAGCRALGESRPQELWRKAEALSSSDIQWHLVGPLQRNKVKRTVPWIDMLHSGDREQLLLEVNRIAAQCQRSPRVLLEVNISGDESKHGLAPSDVRPLLPKLADLKQIEVCGLMAMASLGGNQETARRDFRRLRELRDQLLPDCPDGISLAELSMGMSGDFEVAIEEGATIVRIGSALFEGAV